MADEKQTPTPSEESGEVKPPDAHGTRNENPPGTGPIPGND